MLIDQNNPEEEKKAESEYQFFEKADSDRSLKDAVAAYLEEDVSLEEDGSQESQKPKRRMAAAFN